MYDSELTAMAGESYERAYPAMVLVQQLAELEECIEYKGIFSFDYYLCRLPSMISSSPRSAFTHHIAVGPSSDGLSRGR